MIPIGILFERNATLNALGGMIGYCFVSNL